MASNGFKAFGNAIFVTKGGKPLPKFGEWDVNNPSSAEGFTVIFAKARDDKRTTGTAAPSQPPPSHRNDIPSGNGYNQNPPKRKKWFCCC